MKLQTFLTTSVILALLMIGSFDDRVQSQGSAPTVPALLETNLQTISTKNVDQLRPLQILGRGTAASGAWSGLAWSPDGKTIAVASSTGVWLYQTEALDKVPRTLTNSIFNIEQMTVDANAVAFSPDSRHLAVGYMNGMIGIWSIPEGDFERICSGSDYPSRGPIDALAFSPNGKYLASQGDGIQIWDAATGKERIPLKYRAYTPYFNVAMSADSTRLASGGQNGTIGLWDIETGNEVAILQGHTDVVTGVSFSADGKFLASASYDKTVRLWDAMTGQALATLRGHTGLIRNLTFSPDSTRLASIGDDGVRLWNVNTSEPLLAVLPKPYVNAVSFSPDGNRLVSADIDGSIDVRDVGSGQTLANTSPNPFAVSDLAFSPDGSYLAAGSSNMAFRPDSSYMTAGSSNPAVSSDYAVHLWSIAASKPPLTLRGHTQQVTSIAFSPAGRLLASAGGDRVVRLWNIAAGKMLTSLPTDSDFVASLTFNPAGNLLAVASGWRNRAIQLWDTTTYKLSSILQEPVATEGNINGPTSLAFSPDGKLLASGSYDTTVRLWEVKTGRLLRTLPGHWSGVSGIAFSPDGTRLASAGWDMRILIWKTGTHNEKPDEELFAENRNDELRTIAFSPNGQLLVTGSSAGTLQLWDWARGNAIRTVYCPSGELLKVAFRPDGKLLATLNGDGTIWLWGIPMK